MEKPSSVYIVWRADTPESSELVAVCATQEIAEIAKDLGAAHSIEQVPILTAPPESPKPGLYPWEMALTKRGRITLEPERRGWDEVDQSPVWKIGFAPSHKEMFFYVFAKDKADAIEVAQARRKKAIADGDWGIGWDEWLQRYPVLRT